MGPVTTEMGEHWSYRNLGLGAKHPEDQIEAVRLPLPEIAHQPVAVQAGPTDPKLLAAVAARARTRLDIRYVIRPQRRVTWFDRPYSIRLV